MLLRTESLFLIVVVGLLLFGWRRLPGAMRDLGRARRILKSEAQALRDDVPLPKRRVVEARPEDVVSRRDGQAGT
ncbi:twin-arginine translocase TatA/TatE family subunit [Actinospica durhamensis]|uniref:Twin-arginine translocase TatA/TatE family subunit n=1 Tax=Actinospica durhamensis TaxID=1508375 RepID=A0A941ER89_9ACTN|nr:twin-arginine translocase TatA/TatE family subunit [Actinospica durhamensis]MBR7833649.1 twin-arginine translocase TatA/TatE family subunit [Actinospica durhamensis]